MRAIFMLDILGLYSYAIGRQYTHLMREYMEFFRTRDMALSADVLSQPLVFGFPEELITEVIKGLNCHEQ